MRTFERIWDWSNEGSWEGTKGLQFDWEGVVGVVSRSMGRWEGAGRVGLRISMLILNF